MVADCGVSVDVAASCRRGEVVDRRKAPAVPLGEFERRAVLGAAPRRFFVHSCPDGVGTYSSTDLPLMTPCCHEILTTEDLTD